MEMLQRPAKILLADKKQRFVEFATQVLTCVLIGPRGLVEAVKAGGVSTSRERLLVQHRFYSGRENRHAQGNDHHLSYRRLFAVFESAVQVL